MTLKAAMAAKQAVADHGADARGKAGPEAAGHRPLDDEDVDRPDRRRHQHADAEAGEHELEGGQDDLRACLQGQGLFAHRGGQRGAREAPSRPGLALARRSATLIALVME